MNFSTAAAVEAVVYDMVLADFPRARNRAEINKLFNGIPPFSQEEASQNSIDTNYNDLTATEINQKVRGSFRNALVAPSPLLDVQVDYGPVYRRREWSDFISSQINRKLKKSLKFQEEEDSTIAQVVLHGIGPAVWEDRELWCPRAKGVEDVLVPGGSYRDLDNVPFIAVYEQYTAKQLWECISGPYVDPGWNVPLCEALVQWAQANVGKLAGTIWPDPWKPEKWQERIKEDAGLFASDRTPTIDTYHLYYWSDEGKSSGWRKKIIMDSWGQPGTGAALPSIQDDKYKDASKYLKNAKKGVGPKGMFLFDGGTRRYGEDLSQICHWQFGDASCVAPFMYHSVRSLGFMLYAVCELQNRFNCRVFDAVFESLLQYFEVNSPADAARVMQILLKDKAVIPPGVKMIPQNQRWQLNSQAINIGLQKLAQTTNNVSGAYLQDYDASEKEPNETATKTMAKIHSMSAMVGSMLNRAYDYQAFKFAEICRRFCVENSKDRDVRAFRTECFKAGVPKEALNFSRWTVSPVRVIGGGQKMLQIAQSDKLMATMYDKLDGDAQQDLKRLYIAVNSDYDLANRLVPQKRGLPPVVNKAQNDAGTLMQGLPVTPEDGTNHVDYIEVQLHSMASVIQGIMQTGSMATQQQVTGLGNLGQNIGAHIKILAQDKTAKQKVKIYSDDLGKLMNAVKGLAQRLQEQQQAQQQTNGADPETQGKLKAMVITAQAKAKLAADSHAQKTAQRQIAFQQQIKQDQIRHAAELQKTDLEAASNIRRNGMKSFEE